MCDVFFFGTALRMPSQISVNIDGIGIDMLARGSEDVNAHGRSWLISSMVFGVAGLPNRFLDQLQRACFCIAAITGMMNGR